MKSAGIPVQIRSFRPEDEPAVIALWQNPEWFLVGLVDGQIVVTVMAGYEGHRGWLNYLAVAPNFQRRGLAREMVAEAERLLRNAGCPKINLQIRTSNQAVIEFYRRLGYSVDDVVSMGKRLEPDDPP
jgi:ribosomal protein S18 acetylase RimI-like enzyme